MAASWIGIQRPKCRGVAGWWSFSVNPNVPRLGTKQTTIGNPRSMLQPWPNGLTQDILGALVSLPAMAVIGLVLMWGVTPDRNAVGPVLTYADDHTHYWPLVVFGVASIIVLDPIVSCTRLWARVGQVAR
jgi:hypothetical protein